MGTGGGIETAAGTAPEIIARTDKEVVNLPVRNGALTEVDHKGIGMEIGRAPSATLVVAEGSGVRLEVSEEGLEEA